jgi:hypothetical protein
MRIKSFYTKQTTAKCFPKNLIPCRDSNSGLLVPEADAMISTAPRKFCFGLGKAQPKLACFDQDVKNVLIEKRASLGQAALGLRATPQHYF